MMASPSLYLLLSTNKANLDIYNLIRRHFREANGILSKVLQVGYTRAKCGTCLRISRTYGERSGSPIGVGRKYDELEIEIGVVKLKLFSNSQFDFSKLDILLCPEIEY